MIIWKTIKYQLHLLQLENYELGRYWKLLFKRGLWPKGELRQQLVWTMKALLLFLASLATHLIFFILVVINFAKFGLSVSSILYLVLCIILFFLYFILYTIYLILLWPVDWLAKQIIIAKAKSKIQNLKSEIKIIGIAGSYGKTTMKEVLHQVLGSRFKVQSTPESVNTEVGIARWILKNFLSSDNSSPSPRPSPARGEGGDIEVAIVEMGEHYQGDIAALCKITPPDIAVVTGINEAHLERMKTLENITSTIFEVVSNAKPGAMVVLNGDDGLAMKHYKEFVLPDHKVEKYQVASIKNQAFNTDKLCWEGEVDGVGKININLLGEYAVGDVDAAIKIAKSLGMTDTEIKIGIEKIRPVAHRLQPLSSEGGVLIIDDSYNGNPAGAAEAIKVLSRFTGRRKVYITPGLVETGKAAPAVHREIGRQLANVADVVVLIKNSVTQFIAGAINGMSKNQITSTKPQIIWFNTAPEAHASLGKILKPDDVVLFQNDWGDQYL